MIYEVSQFVAGICPAWLSSLAFAFVCIGCGYVAGDVAGRALVRALYKIKTWR